MPLVGLLSRAFLSCFLFKSYFCNIMDIRQIFTYMCADFHQPMFYGQNNYHMIVMHHAIEKKNICIYKEITNFVHCMHILPNKVVNS